MAYNKKYFLPFHFCNYICSMEASSFFITILVLILVIVSIYKIIEYYKENSSNGFSLPYEFILQSKTHFYQQLPPDIKKRFLHRLENFINNHDFEGHQGLVITDDMRVLISAAAIHLTLGLNDYELSDFKKIFVYPDVYYSGYSKTTNRGETNPHGIIALTWQYVEEGFADITDKMNLGYHEFAHALVLQHVNGGLKDEMFSYGYQKFCYLLQKEHLAKLVEDARFMRDYAFTNKMEFFAASAEYFLEAPQEMYEHSKELFYIMVRMLRQDPTHQYYGLSFRYNTEDEMFQTDY
jgi:MtfA peptidase